MKASFQFPSLLKLLDFVVTTKVNYYSMNRENFILVAHVSDAEIELAISAYDAEMMSITRIMRPQFKLREAI
ncbi:MAG: hypothetical protein JWP88_184 [Flaviaesturariibacter sp.]|nr:hypothetical protein [Flaviaesturariibacter sp.]